MPDQDRVRTIFQDLNNQTAVNLLYVGNDLVDAELLIWSLNVTAIVATNVTTVRRDIAVVGPSIASGGPGAYATHNDMATLEFDAADGSVQPVTVVGPLETIFMPDDTTINPANPDVADVIAWCIANATTKDASPLVEYRRGWRWYLDT